MNICILYLASPKNSILSTGEKRFDMLKNSVFNTSKIFINQEYLIFNEDFTNVEETELLKINNNCKFIKLDFERNDLDFKKFGRPKGYMLMCRFFSGELQNYLIKHHYDGYIRFDDDSFLIEPLLNLSDIINETHSSDYIFRSLFIDGQSKFNNGTPMQSLYNFTKEFLISEGYTLDIQYLKKIGFLNKNGLYSGLAPYNNFHFTNLNIWKHPLIQKYINLLLKNNGCLMNYWMDANIHSMIIFILFPLINARIKLLANFGYRHNRHFSLLNSSHITYNSKSNFFPKLLYL